MYLYYILVIICYHYYYILVMTNNMKAQLPGQLSGNGIVEFELSKPRSAPKYPYINNDQKEEGEGGVCY